MTLKVTEPWTERLFERGDRVRVEFDDGMGPAEVLSADRTYVQVKYGRGGKYTTSLPRGSVVTDNLVRHDASVEGVLMTRVIVPGGRIGRVVQVKDGCVLVRFRSSRGWGYALRDVIDVGRRIGT